MHDDTERAVNDSSLGLCPECGNRILSANLLIRYETTAGARRIFAECRNCEVPVRPR